ncbi:hypothetical protein TcCL_Unassigned03078 [Trypanosoma cruzi]|nr:hypothetical protein TcCL_Unassigned03078 [Trypanosoma cruzi]
MVAGVRGIRFILKATKAKKTECANSVRQGRDVHMACRPRTRGTQHSSNDSTVQLFATPLFALEKRTMSVFFFLCVPAMRGVTDICVLGEWASAQPRGGGVVWREETSPSTACTHVRLLVRAGDGKSPLSNECGGVRDCCAEGGDEDPRRGVPRRQASPVFYYYSFLLRGNGRR